MFSSKNDQKMSNSSLKIGSSSVGRMFAGGNATGKLYVGGNLSAVNVSSTTQPLKDSGFTISDLEDSYTTNFQAGDYVIFNNFTTSSITNPKFYLGVNPNTNRFSTLSATTPTMNENTIIDNAVFILEDADDGLFWLKNVGTGLYIGWGGRVSYVGAPFVSENDSSKTKVELRKYTYDSDLGDNTYFIVNRNGQTQYGINNLNGTYTMYNWWTESPNSYHQNGVSCYNIKKVNRIISS